MDRAWLQPGSGVVVWADVTAPTADDGQVLRDVVRHSRSGGQRRAREDASTRRSRPTKRCLYVVLHGIDFQAIEHAFATHDRTSSWRRASWSPSTTASGAASRTSRAICARSDRHPGRRPDRIDASHRRHHGRPLPARGRGAGRVARRPRAAGARSAGQAADQRDSGGEARHRQPAADRPAAARRRRPARPPRVRFPSTRSGPICSATSTTRWCTSPTTA